MLQKSTIWMAPVLPLALHACCVRRMLIWPNLQCSDWILDQWKRGRCACVCVFQPQLLSCTCSNPERRAESEEEARRREERRQPSVSALQTHQLKDFPPTFFLFLSQGFVFLNFFFFLVAFLHPSFYSYHCYYYQWNEQFPRLRRFHVSMGTTVSKRKNLRNDAISSVAAKVRWVTGPLHPNEAGWQVLKHAAVTAVCFWWIATALSRMGPVSPSPCMRAESLSRLQPGAWSGTSKSWWQNCKRNQRSCNMFLFFFWLYEQILIGRGLKNIYYFCSRRVVLSIIV